MIDWESNLPPGVLASDVSDRDHDRREDEQEDDFWDVLWDHAYRFEEENQRDND